MINTKDFSLVCPYHITSSKYKCSEKIKFGQKAFVIRIALRYAHRNLQPSGSDVAFYLAANTTTRSLCLPLQCGVYTPLEMRKYLDISLTLIVTLTLTVVMLWPLDQPPPVPEGSDKIVHLIAFAALAFPLARTGRFGLLPVFIGASAFGGIIELIQPSFNRSANVNDWVADVMGVVLGIACGLLYRRLRRR